MKYKEKWSFLIFKMNPEVVYTLPWAQSLVVSSSWQKIHMKTGSSGAEESCAFTSTDMEFTLAEDLDTDNIVNVCVENRVPESEKKSPRCAGRVLLLIKLIILDDSHFGSPFKVSSNSKLKSKQERERKMKERNINDRLKNDTHKTI